MTDRANVYSVKKPTHWLWRVNFTREQVLDKLAKSQITDDWLICPIGRPDRSVTIREFASDPSSFESDRDRTDQPAVDQHPMDDPAALVGPVLGASMFNFIGPGLMGNATTYHFPVILLGTIAAEIGLVASWGVFSAQPISRRLKLSAVFGLIFYGSFGLGLFGAAGGAPGAFVFLLFGLLVCPLVLFSAQMPLWVARIWGRLEIALPDQATQGSYRNPIRIRDFFIATTAIGITFALARIGARLLDVPDEMINNFFAGLAALAAVTASVALALVLPLICFTLAQHHSVRVSIAFVAWCVALALAIVTVVSLTAPGTPDLLEAFSLGAIICAAIVCAGLLAARRRGYRIRRG